MITIWNGAYAQDWKLQRQCCGQIWEIPAIEIASALYKQLNDNCWFLWRCALIVMMWRYTRAELLGTCQLMALYEIPGLGCGKPHQSNEGLRLVGATPSLLPHIYAIVACTGTNLPVPDSRNGHSVIKELVHTTCHLAHRLCRYRLLRKT
jgi:hypothetical protein